MKIPMLNDVLDPYPLVLKRWKPPVIDPADAWFEEQLKEIFNSRKPKKLTAGDWNVNTQGMKLVTTPEAIMERAKATQEDFIQEHTTWMGPMETPAEPGVYRASYFLAGVTHSHPRILRHWDGSLWSRPVLDVKSAKHERRVYKQNMFWLPGRLDLL